MVRRGPPDTDLPRAANAPRSIVLSEQKARDGEVVIDEKEEGKCFLNFPFGLQLEGMAGLKLP